MSDHLTRGAHSTLYVELRRHPEKFRDFLRMSVESFDVLLQQVKTRIQCQDNQLRRRVSPEERLIVTLRFLATGESFSSLNFQFFLGKSTISSIVRDTCKALWECLHQEFIPHPSVQQWIDIADKFWEVTRFPNCVGAVNGKHILIQRPSNPESEFLSTIIMAIANAEYKFVAVDIGQYGRTNESRVIRNSAMVRRLYSGDFGLPAARPFPGTDGSPMPFVFVGDEASQMCGNLVKPYSRQGLNYRQRVYNHRLTRARRSVEYAFGIMTSRWQIFTRPIQVSPTVVKDLVKAAVVLHNFILSKEPLPIDYEEMVSSLSGLQGSSRRSNVAFKQMRNYFSQYFLSEHGWVDGQDCMI
ncbi:uncharacterized protein LOC130293341 isoform X2 [Hyla sarda]|nr:uncharacterized protein LOC130293341 isoform X2 [Hyla sarda]XP_056397869.1 uncharacterized protein LOC130293341 isoform X2 [Hyla sarda]